jgi:hypothetical protein
MINARLADEIHHVRLEMNGVPPITDAFGQDVTVTGLRLTYRGPDREIGAIRFQTAYDSDLFVADEDLTPANWPTWLREVIDQYRPAERPEAEACPDCSVPAVGGRIPTHTAKCPRNDPNF